MDYKPENYKTTFETQDGAAILEFLIARENIIRMETACFLSRPAIEPLSPHLLRRFGEGVRADRIKQMMGHMVRQIMEYRGYRLEQGNVKITSPNNMFSRASRYAAQSEVK